MYFPNQLFASLTHSLLIIAISGSFSCQRKEKKPSDPSIFDFPLEEITIDEMQDKLESGIYTSVQVTKMYLDRFNQIDINGIELKSIIELNHDAVGIAAELDREREHGQIRGPLHGIPVLIKDNIDTGDGMKTTAGSLALNNHRAEEDAKLVSYLRKAGAIIMGKTNMSEWSNFRSHNSISGWSSRGGQTKNPYILDQLPCGSSSGSAVAVASNICMVAVGTSTDGSIACPASLNGVVGIRPTVGVISTQGIIPISKTLDTPGAIARTVIDAVILLEAMMNPDQLALLTDDSTVADKNYLRSRLSTDGLRGKRIGVEKAMIDNESKKRLN